MRKGQKVKYQDKYYFVKAIIRRKENTFILLKQNKVHIEVGIEDIKLVSSSFD